MKNSDIKRLKYRAGNVFKLKHGYKIIIYSSNSKGVDWISFSSSGTSGFTPYDTTKSEVDCEECVMQYGRIFDDCETCHGAGLTKETRYGMDEATKLADNVNDFIMNGFKKIMDL